jgi:MoxR-like ATPase
MPEAFRFQPEKVREYQEKIENLRKEGGFMLEKRGDKNYILFLGIRTAEMQERDVIVEFETNIEDEREIQEILKEFKVQQTSLFRKMFTFLVDTYNQERIPLLQSVPGTGKTYSYFLFNKLLHGKEAKVEYIQCTPRTSELELIGHWSPSGGETSLEGIRAKLEKMKEWQDFVASFENQLQALAKKKDVLSEEEFQKEFASLTRNFMERQREVLELAGEKTSDYVFRKGAILSGFKDPKNPEDKGRFVIIDEIDNLPENYQNILLQLSGPQGKLTKKFTSYSDSGITDYERGENTFFALAANYPELATGKRTISGPLADRLDFLSILPNESLEDEKTRIKEFGFSELNSFFSEGTDSKTIDNLRKLTARTLAFWHSEFKKRLSDFKKEGLELPGGVSRIREQEKEFSQRTAIGFEDYVLSHLNDPDFLNPETGRVDLGKLLITAFEHKYLSFLVSSQLKARFYNEVIYPFLYSGGKMIVQENGEFKIKEVPEEVKIEAPFIYIEEDGQFRLFNPNKDDPKMALPLNKVFDILVERVSITAEERAKLEAEEKEIQKREIQRIKYEMEDAISKSKENFYIPEEIKKILEE